MNHIAVIGGGIVGLAAAYALKQADSSVEITIMEKESRWGAHQTGHNSGVIHSGIYYKPGSYKARFARLGGEMLIHFCRQYGVPFERCGKVIVATNEQELPLLKNLYHRGLKNGLDLELIDQDRLRDFEPHISGIEAIRVKETGIVDYTKVCETIVSLLKDAGAELLLNTEVERIVESSLKVDVITNRGARSFDFAVNCAGLHSDRIARASGIITDLKIVPFRGEYYKLRPEKRYLVKNLVYPVPNPQFPFLGVHLTRMINGEVEVGPNAVLGFKREGYKKTDIDAKDVLDIFSFKGFWKLAFKYWREGMEEMVRSYSKKAFLKNLQRLLPEVEMDDLIPTTAGVRAQALRADGTLVDDFYIINTKRTVHVLNAPSPAATACLPIGEEIARRVADLTLIAG
ncbi:L-2-hydroxyglutarate oxidase [Saccharococcus caldoxylosilyticus]|jgi:(S)-2-hydroxyglutarate dehydrogenase|uniref:Putative oxidoreductase n=1 Tax=Parageobacillus caldoxylosilyticus NBRC 107762 TaxID=1220594 RepID=A0A023DJ42_9BACL|nr:L-2-hydroxyglutarate oxidase [Parageobacillus caldoxylosilyticus]GAJ41319.1 putative oxidoreductase [Parageobacillus caldoxylosilyticus NBRC 107762]